MWKKGRHADRTSAPEIGNPSWIWQEFATRFAWVSITPFGSPVVPLEYGSTARSCRVDRDLRRRRGRRAGSVKASRPPPRRRRTPLHSRSPRRLARDFQDGGTVRRIFARESRSWCSSSRAVSSGFASSPRRRGPRRGTRPRTPARSACRSRERRPAGSRATRAPRRAPASPDELGVGDRAPGRPSISAGLSPSSTARLERAEELGDKPALIDGPTGRTITYAELDQATRRSPPASPRAASGRATRSRSTCRTCPSTRSRSTASAAPAARRTTANPLYTARELEHQLEDSGAKILLTVPPFLDVAATQPRRRGSRRSSWWARPRARAPYRLLGRPAQAPEVEIDPATTWRCSLLERHDRAAEGRDAHPREPGREPRPDPGRVPGLRGRRPHRRLPFFHIYGQTVIMNLGLRSGATIVSMPRFDLEQFLELIQEHRSRGPTSSRRSRSRWPSTRR